MNTGRTRRESTSTSILGSIDGSIKINEMNMNFGKHRLVRVVVLILFVTLFLLSAYSQNGNGAGIQNPDDESAANVGNSSDTLSLFKNSEESSLVENETAEPIQPPEEPMYIKRLKAVLHDEATFYHTSFQEDRKISQLSGSDDVTIEVIKMAVVDLDGNDRKEVIRLQHFLRGLFHK